ncbi:putative DNA-binding protein with PD1-like motif [Pseudomonas sp. URIL14HWK12:I3]|uniref:PPC domain-containing DNA-binding protein n=1 Tax=Pseudomonas TaxID=286 RepID=UPI00048DB6BC|nr:MULTISPECIES: PPC domain-containing DNA-binding protein [Pseudomonas]PZW54537.1 putative DNA-binding protein with PD1-like motif [Pseudomonas sp. URIL14HWK12:I2]PZW59880.1 putative DNA-binding protein with PD1-like motif [Pseudomonas sp. URIL14HWK12:I3]QDC04094.1 DNA-binding protein [Pseudomonas sp. SWI7]TFA88998.1 putative DNA-binding protein with PD1-like motif [Pseudomonas sp. URIL14HWK12:I1]SNB73975.1 Predicted DNA-binding protein with PD1-like DNA-binding motif [Pseudomonas sp. LAIL14H
MTPALSTTTSQVQQGRLGRLVVARLKPNEDVIDSAEALCASHGIACAVVRGGLGSLIDGELRYHGERGHQAIHVPGPGIEILSLSGEVIAGRSHLQAVLADADGKLFAGCLQRGRNLSFITVELTLQEWLQD